VTWEITAVGREMETGIDCCSSITFLEIVLSLDI
jgi:hypothetical protein